MKYNTERAQMILPEYGRLVHELVAKTMAQPDRERRQRMAEALVGVMAQMNPRVKGQPDHTQLLWDHLALISGYQLDVDYPTPITRMDEAANRPQRMPYPERRIRQKQYGHLLEQCIDQLAGMPEGAEREELTHRVACQMKQCLYDRNRDAMDADKVATDLAAYTEGKVRIDPRQLQHAAVNTTPQPGSTPVKKKKRKK